LLQCSFQTPFSYVNRHEYHLVTALKPLVKIRDFRKYRALTLEIENMEESYGIFQFAKCQGGELHVLTLSCCDGQTGALEMTSPKLIIEKARNRTVLRKRQTFGTLSHHVDQKCLGQRTIVTAVANLFQLRTRLSCTMASSYVIFRFRGCSR
jgi:hypothetical protein